MADPRNITIAQLHGTARRHSTDGTDTEAAVANLQTITTDPVLLGKAAGTTWAEVQHAPEIYPFSQRALELLVAAGADRATAEAEAAVVLERMGSRGHEAPKRRH